MQTAFKLFVYLVALSVGGISVLAAEMPSKSKGLRELRLTYEIFVGGFHSGHVNLSVHRNSKYYELFAVTTSMGPIDFLVGFRSYAQSRGEVSEEGFAPYSHHVNNVWTGDIRFVRIDYDKNQEIEAAPVRTVVHPTHEIDERDLVAFGDRRGTIDPLSAALRAAHQSDGSNGRTPCNDSIPVFDGRRRYNLNFEDVGSELIDGPYYDGQALKCRTSIERIAGFSGNPFLPQSKDLEGGEIWFAELVPNFPPIPVRFKADIGLGNAFVHLMNYEWN